MRTGSLVNHLMGESTSPEPAVGLGATILYWSDRHPATVVEVSKSGKAITVQEDNAKRTDNNGLSESQEYEYSENPNGRKMVFSLRKNGAWVEKNSSMQNGVRLLLGSRNKYYDYSF